MELKYLAPRRGEDTNSVSQSVRILDYLSGLTNAGTIRNVDSNYSRENSSGEDHFLFQFELLDETKRETIEKTLIDVYKAKPAPVRTG
jgi:hypothetical protein